jgi:predicted ATPase
LELKRVIITGGPSTGKTSLINELEKKGYDCIHETSREIIQEALANDSNILPWKDHLKFSERVILQRKNHYFKAKTESSKKYTFFDRGIPDVFAYLKYDKIKVPEKFIELGNTLRYYSKIFLTPAWKNIYENDNERVEDFDKAEKLQHLIHHTYKKLGYEVILIPKTTIEKRINFILNHLNE